MYSSSDGWMDGWAGWTGGCVCFSMPATIFLADLHIIISNVGGERRPVGRGCGRRGHVVRRPGPGRSCRDRPTNFLVLPTFAMFSAH